MRKGTIFSVASTLTLAMAAGGCRTSSNPTPAAKDPVTQSAVTTTEPQGSIAQTETTEPSRDGDEAGEWGILDRNDSVEYQRTIDKVVGMVSDGDVVAKARRRSLSVVNVMWEDTGRAQGSALGPNISDLTLQVRRKDPSGNFVQALMPVIRPPNFTDRTGDVPADKFFVRVGNERAGTLRSVPLTDVLKNLKEFASAPNSILGSGNLLAPRDSHFLVSAQAVFLPIPKSGKAECNPVLFNYQSAPGSPAVLSILVTREGTSASVIENKPEDRAGSSFGQEIYFNNKGQRAAFTAERRSDVAARIEAQGGPKTEADRSALAKGADVLFLIQVPLVHEHRGRLGGALPPPAPTVAMPKKAPAPSAIGGGAAMESAAAERSDVEQAVLGHGPNLGPFNEGRGLKLVRDPKFPIRVTVQFYKATSNGVVSDTDLDSIARSIGSVYEHAEFVGSLVLPEGDPRRPTAWQKIPHEWFPW